MTKVEGPSKGMRVVVADDDDDLRSVVAETLRSNGHSTLEAHDGEELLDLLWRAYCEPTDRPDVLVTDVRMPKLSGLGVMQALRRVQWSLPVVMMTGSSDPSIETLAKRFGAVAFLTKPFTPDDLLAAMHKAEAASALHRPSGK
jgi:CheY-like chemotaxis protein